MPKTTVRVYAQDIAPGQYETDLTPDEANARVAATIAERSILLLPLTDTHGQLVNTYIDMRAVVTVVVIPPTHVSTALH